MSFLVSKYFPFSKYQLGCIAIKKVYHKRMRKVNVDNFPALILVSKTFL